VVYYIDNETHEVKLIQLYEGGDKMKSVITGKKGIALITVIMAIAIIGTGSVFAFSNQNIDTATNNTRNGFMVNENDQTYGTIKTPNTLADLIVSTENTPDLIACVGIDGIQGYCYITDLDGEQPNNPEEALEYMNRLRERRQEMIKTGEQYVRIIPLYAEDGKTIIGEFGIS